MTTDPLSSIRAASEALDAGDITSVELTRESLARADRIDGALGAYLHRLDDSALLAARAADRERAQGVVRGRLHGVPMAVKDLLAVRECATTAQSAAYDETWWTGRDASTVARLRAAGAVITGKTTTMEYAFGFPDESNPFPLSRNPWDLARWAGGSSSGSASGAAAGLFPAAIGTDTGGSLRLPAAMCGATGLKPTYGRVARDGCIPFAAGMDHVGPIGRSAWDCAALLQAISGPCADDPSASGTPVPDWCAVLDADTSVAGLRVGVLRAIPAVDDPTGVLECIAQAVQTIGGLGVSIEEIDLPYLDETEMASRVVVAVEVATRYRVDDRYGSAFRRFLEFGSAVTVSAHDEACEVLRRTRAALAALWDAVDVVVMPTYVGATPVIADVRELGLAGTTGKVTMGKVLCGYWNATGNPAISVPVGFGTDRMPVGMQIVGRDFDEAAVLMLAHAYQSVTRWHEAVPPWIS